MEESTGVPTVDQVEITEELCNYIAQAAHEVNRVWCEINNDKTKLPWGQSQGHLRAGTRAGVRCLLEKLNENDLPDAAHQHMEWVEERTDQGWVYGYTYDPSKKIHPNLVPFADLTVAERCKDNLFLNTVITLYKNIQETMRACVSSGDTVAMPPPNEPQPGEPGYQGAGSPDTNQPDEQEAEKTE